MTKTYSFASDLGRPFPGPASGFDEVLFHIEHSLGGDPKTVKYRSILPGTHGGEEVLIWTVSYEEVPNA